MSAPTRPQALVDYLRLAADYLQKSGSASPRLDAELLLAHVLGMDRVALYVNFDRPLVPGEVDRYRELLRQRARGTPIAYILGSKPFLTTRVAVGPGVLIPRPETELLVEAAAARLREMPGAELLAADVGTGSGAIAIGLALLEPRARVAALTFPPTRCAQPANAERHGLENASGHGRRPYMPLAERCGPPLGGPADAVSTRRTSPRRSWPRCPGTFATSSPGWPWTAGPTA